jgi:hypothetical protein
VRSTKGDREPAQRDPKADKAATDLDSERAAIRERIKGAARKVASDQMSDQTEKAERELTEMQKAS